MHCIAGLIISLSTLVKYVSKMSFLKKNDSKNVRTIFSDKFFGQFFRTTFWDNFLGQFFGTIFSDNFFGQFFRTIFPDNFFEPGTLRPKAYLSFILEKRSNRINSFYFVNTRKTNVEHL
jgi:hypothetical protein